MLADLVETLRAGRFPACKDETAVVDRRGADDAASLGDPPQLGYDNCWIIKRFEHRVAKNRVERGLGKRQLSAVGRRASEVSQPD